MSNVDISGYVTGAAQPKINQANLNRIPVVTPTESLLSQFDEIVEGLLAQNEVLKRKISTFARPAIFFYPNSFQVKLM